MYYDITCYCIQEHNGINDSKFHSSETPFMYSTYSGRRSEGVSILQNAEKRVAACLKVPWRVFNCVERGGGWVAGTTSVKTTGPSSRSELLPSKRRDIKERKVKGMCDCNSSIYRPTKNNIKNQKQLLFAQLLPWGLKKSICESFILQYKVQKRQYKGNYDKTNYMHWFLKFIFGIKLYMFRTVPLSIIRSFSLCTKQ